MTSRKLNTEHRKGPLARAQMFLYSSSRKSDLLFSILSLSKFPGSMHLWFWIFQIIWNGFKEQIGEWGRLRQAISYPTEQPRNILSEAIQHMKNCINLTVFKPTHWYYCKALTRQILRVLRMAYISINFSWFCLLRKNKGHNMCIYFEILTTFC